MDKWTAEMWNDDWQGWGLLVKGEVGLRAGCRSECRSGWVRKAKNNNYGGNGSEKTGQMRYERNAGAGVATALRCVDSLTQLGQRCLVIAAVVVGRRGGGGGGAAAGVVAGAGARAGADRAGAGAGAWCLVLLELTHPLPMRQWSPWVPVVH